MSLMHVSSGSTARRAIRYQVTHHMYLASGEQLSYIPSVERVDG